MFDKTQNVFKMHSMHQIKQYREKAGLTQDQLGKLIGSFGQSTISNYETRSSIPELPVCRRIVKTLNDNGIKCSLDDVFPPNESDSAA
jgi:putative transcriptional regulator